MNQSKRLLTLFDSLIGRGANQPMTQVWSAVFELNPQSPSIEDDITVCLMALRSEIDSVGSKLTALGITSDLIDPGFSRFKNTASPVFINQGWDGVRGNVQAPECRFPFLWAAWVLREEDDDEITSADKADIEEALSTLEAALTQSNISPYLRGFVQRQLLSIRRAIRISTVEGVEPLREAMRKFAGDLKVEDAKFKEAVSASPKDAQATLTALADVVDKSAKVCDGATKIWGFTQSVGGTISDLIQLLPN